MFECNGTAGFGGTIYCQNGSVIATGVFADLFAGLGAQVGEPICSGNGPGVYTVSTTGTAVMNLVLNVPAGSRYLTIGHRLATAGGDGVGGSLPGCGDGYDPEDCDSEGPCLADFNMDGSVDSQDVVEFFIAWDNGENAADLNGDDSIDSEDLVLFFLRFEVGC